MWGRSKNRRRKRKVTALLRYFSDFLLRDPTKSALFRMEGTGIDLCSQFIDNYSYGKKDSSLDH